MTPITINRAVVERALEALEAMQSYAAAERKGLRICDEAITALRAALAEQRLTDVQREMERSIESLKAALAQQAEPVEPVAWMHTNAYNPEVRFLEWTQQPKGYRGDWVKTPLCNCVQPQQAEPVQAKFDEVAVEQWKLRMVFYDENGEPLMSRQPEPDEIRAALAQQAEPVGVVSSGVKGGVIWHRWPDQMPDGTKLHAAPHQRAEPVEPVFEVGFGWLDDATKYPKGTKLYTAPPKRLPLTEGALMGAYMDFDRKADKSWSNAEYLLAWARAAIKAVEGGK